jgi:hypothetical protein
MPKFRLPAEADIPPPVECVCNTGKPHAFTAELRTDFYITSAGVVPFATCPPCRAKTVANTEKKKIREKEALDKANEELVRLTNLVAQAEITAEAVRVATEELSLLRQTEDVEENELRIAELKVVRLEALADGERVSRHKLRRQVGQESRTPSPPPSPPTPTPSLPPSLASSSSSQMSSRSRNRPYRATPTPFDARTQASDDSDDRHTMKRRGDAEYSARLKADLNFYWTLVVKVLMSILFTFSAFAGIVKMFPGILTGFINMVGVFGEVCAVGVAFCACANQNRTCDCDNRRM